MAEGAGLLVNAAAAVHSSRGVRRYFDLVMRHLPWSGPLQVLRSSGFSPFDRLRDFVGLGRSGYVTWTPCQRGILRTRNHVMTIHDCINVEHVYAGDWRLPFYRRLVETALSSATAIVAISEATKAAVLRNYRVESERIVVIRSGSDVIESTPVQVPELALPAPFILMVLNDLPHKNGQMACEAFIRSKVAANGWMLVVVGRLSDAALLALKGANVRFELRHWVDEPTLMALYRSCRFLLSPSLEEGHNLVIAEAIENDARVVCSDIPVHREFYAGRVRWFVPQYRDDIIRALDEAAEADCWLDSEMRLPVRTFADVAMDYASLFQQLSGSNDFRW